MVDYIVAGGVLLGIAIVALAGRRIVRWWRSRNAVEAREDAHQVQLDAHANVLEREQVRRQARELAEQQADEAARRDAAGGLGDQLRRDIDAAGPRPPHRPGPR